MGRSIRRRAALGEVGREVVTPFFSAYGRDLEGYRPRCFSRSVSFVEMVQIGKSISVCTSFFTRADTGPGHRTRPLPALISKGLCLVSTRPKRSHHRRLHEGLRKNHTERKKNGKFGSFSKLLYKSTT